MAVNGRKPKFHYSIIPLHWRHNGRDGVSNHKLQDYLLKQLLRRRSKKISKLRVIGLCAGNSPGTGEFPAQMASNAKMFPLDDVIMTEDVQQYFLDRSWMFNYFDL